MFLFYRYILRLLILPLITISLLIGCGLLKKSQPTSETKPGPIALVPERNIEGVVLGKELSRPFGIVSDNIGHLYVVDAGNSRLLEFDTDLKPIREAGGFGRVEGLLNSPTYMALDNNLNLYISDAGNQRISIFDTRLNFVDNINLIDPDDPFKFGRPAGLTINDYGELLMVDPDNSRIAIFNNFANFDRFLGDTESYIGLLLTPSAIDMDQEGNFIVSDIGNSKLVSFDSYGIYLSGIGSENVVRPSGIDIDRFGNIWVVDAGLPAVLCFNRRGDLLFSVGDYGSYGNYSFNQPQDLTLLPKDRIVVCDTGNDRLLIYRILYPE